MPSCDREAVKATARLSSLLLYVFPPEVGYVLLTASTSRDKNNITISRFSPFEIGNDVRSVNTFWYVRRCEGADLRLIFHMTNLYKLPFDLKQHTDSVALFAKYMHFVVVFLSLLDETCFLLWFCKCFRFYRASNSKANNYYLNAALHSWSWGASYFLLSASLLHH